MEQERKLLHLQELVREELKLQKKEELLPMIKHLKGLRDTIKTAEEEAKRIEQQIVETKQYLAQLEKQAGIIADKVKGGKEKLYNSKGGSLKELLSLQQSILKLEAEAEKGNYIL